MVTSLSTAVTKPGKLKPLQDGDTANCRPSGICRTKVKVRFNCGPHLPNKYIKYLTLLCLPMNNVQVTRTNAPNQLTLFTFDGLSDWLNLAQQDFEALIFGHAQSINKPYSLDAPRFDNPGANANKLKK